MNFRYGFLCLIIALNCSLADAAMVCSGLFDPGKVEIDKTIVTWYMSMAMPGERWISRDPNTGKREILLFSPTGGHRDYTRTAHLENVELTKDAPDSDRTYYAKVSLNRSTQHISTVLHPIAETTNLNKMIDKTVDFTWETYLKQEVVTTHEIEQFKKTEAELAPQRKINFITTTLEGETAAIMRVYDGSPYPFSFLGARPEYFEKVSGDARLPIERRYPHLSIRADSPYVFEAGRLAKADNFDNGLEYQFYNLGAYLMTKFGFLGVATPEYFVHGRIYAEITTRHLKHYMREREKGGLGFNILAASRNDGPMTPVPKNTNYEDLKIDRNENSKFIVYLTVKDFISKFYRMIEMKDAAEVYPETNPNR